MKICRKEAELFHADKQTDMEKLIVAFRNFVIAPKQLLRLPGFETRTVQPVP